MNEHDGSADRPSKRLTPDEQRRFRELMAGLDTEVDMEALEAEVATSLGSRRLRLLAALNRVLGWWWVGPVLMLAGLISALILISSSVVLSLAGIAVAALGAWHLARLVLRTITRLSAGHTADRAGSPGRHSAGDRGSDQS